MRALINRIIRGTQYTILQYYIDRISMHIISWNIFLVLLITKIRVQCTSKYNYYIKRITAEGFFKVDQ